MADELGSVSVKIKVEISQLEKGLDKARAETEKFDKDTNKKAKDVENAWIQASARAVSAIGEMVNAFSSASAASKELSASVTTASQTLNKIAVSEKNAAQSSAELASSLREQITLFGKSTDDVLRYRAAQIGAQKSIESLIVELRQLHDAQEAVNRAVMQEAIVMDAAKQSQDALSNAQHGLIERLREQVFMFGKSNIEIAEFEAKMLGVSKSTDPLIKKLRELTAAQTAAEQAAREEAAAQQSAALTKKAAISAQESFIAALRDQAAMQGKSRIEMLEFKAAQLGVTNETTQYIRRIRAFEESTNGVGRAMRGAGLSAGEYRNAMRLLPAQMTDVVTSIASGMPIWLIAIQQGGQIKDSFGGIGETFKALGSLITPVRVLTLGFVGVLAALAFAYKKASDESTAFNVALATTGNIAGTTTDQLAGMASAIDSTIGTNRQAAAALAEIARTGKFASDSIQGIATAAIAMEEFTGKAISETVAEFVRLADEPSQAIATLNEKYHFLTASVFSQIAALEKQNKTIEANTLAVETFKNAQIAMSKKVEDNLGALEIAWKAVKNAASEAGDAMLDVFRSETLEDKLIDAQDKLQRIAQLGGGKGIFNNEAELSRAREALQLVLQQIQARDQTARQEGIFAANQEAAISAMSKIDQLEQQFLTNTQKRNKETQDYLRLVEDIRRVDPSDPRLDPSTIEKNLANISARYKEQSAPIQKLNEQRLETISSLREEVRILETLSAQYINSNMSAEQLATTGEILRTQSLLQVEANSAEGQAIDDLITKRNALTGAIDKETKARELLKQETEATLEFNVALQNTIDARQHAIDIDVASIGMGQKRAALQREINDVTFEYAKRLEDLARAQGTEQALPADIFAARVEALRAAQAQEIAIIQDGAQRKAEAEMDWAAGARQGLEDFSARATDLAGQTSELVGSTLESMSVGVSDALAGAIIQGEDLRDTMANLAQTIYTEVLSALIEMGIRFVTNKVLQLTGIAAVKTAQIASTAATTAASTAAIATTTGVSTAAAATTTTAWAPAATMSSIGSFGAAAAIGLAAVLAALAMSRGFRDGGFTGAMGTNEIAGVVHGGEFVFDAASTSRIGVGNLEAIRSGAANDSIAAPKFQERIRPSGFDNNVDGQIVNPNRMSRSDRMINQNFYIQTPDADSFRASQRQIARDTKQRMAVT